MARDEGRNEKRRDRWDRPSDRSREKRRDRSRSRSRDRVSTSFRNRSRSRSRSRDRRHGTSEANRRDYRRDDRHGRDRGGDRGTDRGERKRSKERREADTPEPPRANKFFDRARKLGIVPEAAVSASSALGSSSSSDAEQQTMTSSQQSTAVAASLAAARALALSASLTQAGVNRGQTTPLGLPLDNGTGATAGVAIAAPHPDVPSYYNPANVNTQRIADQIKKRKMLWTRPGPDEGKASSPNIEQQQKNQSQVPGSSTTKHWAKATFKDMRLGPSLWPG